MTECIYNKPDSDWQWEIHHKCGEMMSGYGRGDRNYVCGDGRSLCPRCGAIKKPEDMLVEKTRYLRAGFLGFKKIRQAVEVNQ